MMSPGRYVRVDRFDHVLRIVVDRQQALNALNSELLDELIEVLSSAGASADARVVIITGAGDRAFVAGADIKEMSRKSPLEGRNWAKKGHLVTRMVEEMDKPVIAAVNGVALGGGCELALACDIRIASESARFGQPEVNLGIPPGWGATIRLARVVGEGVAREMIFSGKVIDAEEAYRVGLVNAVVPADKLEEEAMKLASTIASRGPVAVAYAKRSMNRARSLDSESAAELESDLMALCFSTQDQREGMDAFIEKRPANFTGK
jgi:enoyl-CoA hydratase